MHWHNYPYAKTREHIRVTLTYKARALLAMWKKGDTMPARRIQFNFLIFSLISYFYPYLIFIHILFLSIFYFHPYIIFIHILFLSIYYFKRYAIICTTQLIRLNIKNDITEVIFLEAPLKQPPGLNLGAPSCHHFVSVSIQADNGLRTLCSRLHPENLEALSAGFLC